MNDETLALGGDRHVTSMLMRDSLLSERTQLSTATPVITILPGVKVVKIGGRSIIDHGKARLYPVVEELGRALDDHKIIIGVGAGVRSRHIFGVGLDLGLPTGVLASLAASDSEQNAHMLYALLAKYGVAALPSEFVIHILPAILMSARGAVVNGTPPFDLWELVPPVGKIPPNRTDAGMFLLADVYGASRVVLIKDVDGLYSSDPIEDLNATLIEKVTLEELNKERPATLPFNEIVLDLLGRARHCTQVQIVNGRVPGMITRALDGEDVGTVISAA